MLCENIIPLKLINPSRTPVVISTTSSSFFYMAHLERVIFLTAQFQHVPLFQERKLFFYIKNAITFFKSIVGILNFSVPGGRKSLASVN